MSRRALLSLTCIIISFFLILQSGRAQYPPDCKGGYMAVYYNYTLDQCRPCHFSCANCSGETSNNCTICSSYTFLYNNTCTKSCPENYFNNSNSLFRECLPCNPACKNCKGFGPLNCTDCPLANQTLLENGTCIQSCPNGKYFNPTTKTCSSCNTGCIMCNGPTQFNCTLCATGYLYTDPLFKIRSCKSTCPNGYFPNKLSMGCDKCDNSCLTCNDRTAWNCTSCPKERGLRMDNQCGNCTTGTFYLSSTGMCEDCDDSCSTCTLNFKACIACRNASYYKENGLCPRCPFGCKTCVNSTFCTSCDSGYVKKKNSCQLDCSSIFLNDVSMANIDCHPCDYDQYWDFANDGCVQLHYCLNMGGTFSLKGDEDDLASTLADKDLRICNYVPPIKKGMITPILLIVPLTIIGFILCIIWCTRVIKWVFKPYTMVAMVDNRQNPPETDLRPVETFNSRGQESNMGGNTVPLIYTKDIDDPHPVKSNFDLIKEAAINNPSINNKGPAEDATMVQQFKKPPKKVKEPKETNKSSSKTPQNRFEKGKDFSDEEAEHSTNNIFETKPEDNIPQVDDKKLSKGAEKRKSIATEEFDPKKEIAAMMSKYKVLIDEYKNISVDLEQELPKLGTPKNERFLLVKPPIKTEYEVSPTFKNEYQKKPVSFRVILPGNILPGENDITKMSVSHLENLFKIHKEFSFKFKHEYLTDLKGIGTKCDPSEGTLNIIVMQERFKNDFELILYEKKVFFSNMDTLKLAQNVVSAVEHLHSHNTAYRNFNIANVFYHTNRKIAKLSTIELFFDQLNLNQLEGEQCVYKFSKMYAYEAPEQITKEDNKKSDSTEADLRKDIWGLGVILHEMFYHRKPNIPWLDTNKEEYIRDNKKQNEKISKMVRNALSKNIKFVNPDQELELPTELEILLSDCLNPEPKKRIDIYEVKQRLNKISLLSTEASHEKKEEPEIQNRNEEKKRTREPNPVGNEVEKPYDRKEPPMQKLPEIKKDNLPPVKRFDGNIPEIPRQFVDGYKPDFPEPLIKKEKDPKPDFSEIRREIEPEAKNIGNMESNFNSFNENFHSDTQEDETLLKKKLVKQGSSSKQEATERKKLIEEHYSYNTNNEDIFAKNKKNNLKQDLERPISSESQFKADINLASFNNSRAFSKNESAVDAKKNEDFFREERKNVDDVMVVEEFDDNYGIEHKKEDADEEFGMF